MSTATSPAVGQRFDVDGVTVAQPVVRRFLAGGAVTGADAAALEAAGWCDAGGEPTERGRALIEDLTDAAELDLLGQDASGSVRGVILAGREQALAVVGRPGQPVTVRAMPLEGVVIFLGHWAGLGAYRESQTEGARLHGAVLAERVREPATPLPAQAGALTAMWAAPWARWSVRCPAIGVDLDHIDAGAAGQFRLRTDGEHVLVTPRPGTLLWGDLQQVLTALPGHRARLDPDDQPEW